MAGPVDSQQAQKAAETFLKARNDRPSKGFAPLSVRSQTRPDLAGFREIRGDDGAILAYITELEPRGFIATSADTEKNGRSYNKNNRVLWQIQKIFTEGYRKNCDSQYRREEDCGQEINGVVNYLSFY